MTVSNCWVLLNPEGGKIISWSTSRYVDSSNSWWPYDQNCQCNPCAGCTIPRCEVSPGGYFRHKNFLLLVVGACYAACKLLVCPSKLMRSNLPWPSPLHYPYPISALLVESHGACLSFGPYCPAKFDICPSHHLRQSALFTLLSMYEWPHS